VIFTEIAVLNTPFLEDYDPTGAEVFVRLTSRCNFTTYLKFKILVSKGVLASAFVDVQNENC